MPKIMHGGVEYSSSGGIDSNSHLNYQYTLDSISVNSGVTEDLGQILLKSDHDVEGKLAIFQGATISSITDSNNNVYNDHYIHELGVFVTDACIINTQNSWDDEIVYTTFRLVNNSSLTIVSCTISFMLSWI